MARAICESTDTEPLGRASILSARKETPRKRVTAEPAIRSGQRVVIAAHGNSLRALVKYLDNVSETDILELNIPSYRMEQAKKKKAEEE